MNQPDPYGMMYKLKARNPGGRWVYAWVRTDRDLTMELSYAATSIDHMLKVDFGLVSRDREWGVDGPMEAFMGLEPA